MCCICFNSLFEMRQTQKEVRAYCGARFNSLFEMQLRLVLTQLKAQKRFNSLFEMLTKLLKVNAGPLIDVSILCLRCCGGCFEVLLFNFYK